MGIGGKGGRAWWQVPGQGLWSWSVWEKFLTPGPALPSVCMASSLCWTCWDIILLIPMRLSVMPLEVWARLSLVVFLKVRSGRRNVNKSLGVRKPHLQMRFHFFIHQNNIYLNIDDHSQHQQGHADTTLLKTASRNANWCYLL